MPSNRLIIRCATEEDAFGILKTHHKAVQEKAGDYYDQNILDLWSPGEITTEWLEKLKQQILGDEWFTLVAEAEGVIIGYGQASAKKNILGAVYVQKNPYGRVGKQILERLIAYARENNVGFLEMDSSTNAEAFYQSAGFRSIARDKHILPSGKEMACVKMRLDL